MYQIFEYTCYIRTFRSEKKMKNILLSTEAACDISDKTIKKYDIRIAPMKFLINGVEFRSDDEDFSTIQVCKFMREGATTKTSQITEYEAEEYLKELQQEGKDILHLSFSGAMSSTADNFKKAAETLNKDSKNKIYVIDTLCQSGGLGLIVNLVAEEIEKRNLSITEACNFVENTKLNISHLFTVDDLRYLARGGRISSTTAFIGNIIKVKPILHLNNDGIITQLQKIISRKKALAVIVEKIKNDWNKSSNLVYISQADAEDEAKNIAQILESDLNLKCEIVPLGPVVCNHSGPGTLAVFYTTNSRV